MFFFDTMQHPCPIPPEKMTCNDPLYKQLYSFGAMCANAGEGNKIYCEPTFGQWYKSQALALEAADKDGDSNVPIYSHEFSTGSTRKYTTCSGLAMANHVRRTKEKFIYWFIREGRLVNFFVDFDLSYSEMTPESRQTRCLNLAMKEFLLCFELALKEQRDDKHNVTFDFDLEYYVSRMDGNRPGKESSHLIFHFKSLRMFKDFLHCKHFFAHVLEISNNRHKNKDTNPLYFKHAETKEFRCIADISVYTKNRNWRCISCSKNKANPKEISGALYPVCPSRLETGDLICSDVTCSYHALNKFTDSEWCENDPMFIPRTQTGRQMVPVVLEVKPLDIGDFKYSGVKRDNSTAFNSKLSTGAFYESRMNMDSNMGVDNNNNNTNNAHTILPDTPPSDRTVTIAPTVLDLARIGAAMIGSVIGHKATVQRFIDEDFAMISTPTNKSCCYKYKRITKRYIYDPTDPDAVLQTVKHISNHVYFLLRIDHPLPVVYIHCTDEDCREFIFAIKRGEIKDFPIQKLRLDSAPMHLKCEYEKMSLGMLMNTVVNSRVFTTMK